MSVAWLQPLAWWGLVALAVPIIIHLLVRQRSRTVPFPSLRFLQVTRAAALRRRVLHDSALLVVRVLTIAAVVAAAAAPVFLSPSRTQSWESRTARALVEVWPAGAMPAEASRPLIEEEQASAFVTWSGRATGRASDVLQSAVEWLERQPPAARELVIVGDLRAGLVTEADLAAVPPAVGIRFLPVSLEVPARTFALPVTRASPGGTPALAALHVTATDAETHVTGADASPRRTDVLEVIASPVEQTIADALRDAVLADGIVLPQSADRRLIVELSGTSPTSRVASPAPEMWMRRVLESAPGGGGERDGALVVRVARSPSDPQAVHEVARVARAVFDERLDDREPRRIAPSTLASWSRAPRGVPESAPLADEGDRRWFWLVALGLIGAEQLIRRRADAEQARHVTATAEERVA